MTKQSVEFFPTKHVEPKAFPRNDLESKHIPYLDLNPNGIAPKLFPHKDSESNPNSSPCLPVHVRLLVWVLQQLSLSYTLSFKGRYVIYRVKFHKPD